MILEKLSGEKFTASEKQVVDFIQQYPRVVINLSLEELAAETFVSQASIIRLSKKLGAKGFADFKIQLAAELSTFAQNEKEIPVDIPIPEGCTTPDIARTFYNLSRQALDTTLHALDVIALQKAVTLRISCSESRYKMGSFASRTAMLFLLDCLYGEIFSRQYERNKDNLAAFSKRKTERDYYYTFLPEKTAEDLT